ncbi:DUF5020 family protein [Puia dinghuensis]|uniref:DUF5020 domain-containing protein n=1 Tax=Puia dinghuensis TaxID=1792502 RepID=A0A8J2UB10_9BACT|nr:DUF5020 family protein [Puia dinghuensis]GGA91773.1 DUF5020 domain-containing protein [Puia dinghuensis]
MKLFATILILNIFLLPTLLSAQNLQLHYDLRHTIDPAQNPRNYPTLYFEYFKLLDTGRAFIKPGSFFLKTEADLLGENNNIGKFFIQASQSFRCWKPKVFINLQYSGGGGITEPKQYSYYIPNNYFAGIETHLWWRKTLFSSILYYKYVPYARPSNDFQYTLYWWTALFNYKVEIPGDFSIWTENKDHGDAATSGQKGKRFFFFAEPQIWYNLSRHLALGSKINMYYHVNLPANGLQVYPTLALKARL